jgi:hypothetical protein
MIVTEQQDFRSFPDRLSDNKTFMEQSKLSLLSRLKFRWKLSREFKKADKRLEATLASKGCFYGPFKGEFGHFLAHTLPFLMYLHSKGVKIHYCGMALHKPFMVDENGESIIASFHELRDFFGEVSPSSNSTIPPQDVSEEITLFIEKTKNTSVPFWNIGDDFYYWFIHRNWLEKGYTHLYDLSKVYGKGEKENACAIFPRSKGAKSSHNNGDAWDYPKLVNELSNHFDKVYVLGHPSQVLTLEPMDRIEVIVTADNAKILKACSKTQLIITQHSGVNNLGEYLRKQVLIIYKGGRTPQDIGSMNNTLRFREMMKEKKRLHFAFGEEDVIEYVSKKMYL